MSLKGPPDSSSSVTDKVLDTSCGYTASCKPAWLQKCANPKAYLVLITVVGIIQGFAINGVNNANTATYERRYLLSSTHSSLVSIFYDISAGVWVLFVGYYGGSKHQPRILAISILAMCLGTFTMSLAHFTAPKYNPSGRGSSVICDLNGNATTCTSDGSQIYLNNYIYLLIFGQILNGVAGACLYTVGITFLDQSAPVKTAALYIGIMSGGSVLGPALGFVLGGSMLDIYVDFPNSPPEGLTPEDPAWVGAWWLGFVASSILSLILALFMFLFPREFPGTAAIRSAKISQAHDNGTEALVNTVGFGMSWRDLPKSTLYLLKNPCYVCISLVSTLEFCVVISMSTFLPKIIANQFALTTSWASILTGIVAVPSAAAGQVIGGIIIKKYNLNVAQIIKLALGSSVAALLMSPVYLARCSDSHMAGMLTGYPGHEIPFETNLTSTCNADCGCTTKLYDPVCADGIQYFSPCYAGCSQEPNTNDEGARFYPNCSCSRNSQVDFSSALNYTQKDTVGGKCALNCDLQYYVFLIVGFVQFFSTFLGGTPLTVITLRIVPEKLRTYGVALHWVFLRFLGSMPGPIIFGAMIDASCSLWQDNCGERGSCWVYNNADLSTRIVILIMVLKSLSVILIVLALKVYKAPKTEIVQENEKNSTKDYTNAGFVSSQFAEMSHL